MLPHLEDRPVTMVRLPDGVAGERFFEKRCPGHRPAWLDTVPLDADSEITACSLEDRARAGLDRQPRRARAAHTAGPRLRSVAAVRRSCSTSTRGRTPTSATAHASRSTLRDLLDQLGLRAVAKTSGSKGLHLSVGIRPSVDADTTKGFALAVGKMLESRDPKRVTVTMAKEQRRARCSSTGARTTGTRPPCARTRCARTGRARGVDAGVVGGGRRARRRP